MRNVRKTALFFVAILLSLLCFGVACEKQEEQSSGCVGHVYGEWVTETEAGCFSEGERLRICGNCGETEREVIPAPEKHTYGEWTVKKEAVCFKEGERVRICEDCGNEEREAIPAPQKHTYGEWIDIKKVSCFTDGEHARICEACGDMERETVFAPREHNYGDWTTEQEATCIAKGVLSRTCSVCKTEERQETEINAKKHSMAATQSYTATTHYTLCLNCKQKFNEGSHTFGEWTTTKPASYKEDGEKSRTCGCSYQEKETLPKLPQETPTYQIPTLTAIYGLGLDEALPAGFTLQGDVNVKTLSVGVHTLKLTYAVPGDTEGRYKTVTDISVTLTVRKKTVAFAPDFSPLAGLVYTGAPAPTPVLEGEYAQYASLTWYQGEEALTGAPTAAGEYTAVVRFISESYTAGADEWSFAFTVAKNPAMLDGYAITDRYYTGEPFHVNAKELFGEGTELVWKENGTVCPAPVEVGEYTLEISIAQTQNYLAHSRTYTLRILEDTVPPVYEEYTVYVTDSVDYEFRATDNAKIAYYQYRRSWERTWRTTADAEVVLENGEEYVVIAVDASGNESEQWLVYTRVPTCYAPTKHSPAKGAIVTKSYVELFATGAKVYYFGTVQGELMPTATPLVEGLEDGKTYYWRASDGVEESETYSFTVSNPTPTQGVVLLYPADGAVINEASFHILATSQAGIAEYYYQIEGKTYWDTSYDGFLDRLDYGMKYFWYVKDNDGNVSQTRSFTYVYGESLNPEGITVIVPAQRVSYVNQPNFYIVGSALAGERYVRYYQSSTERYTTESFEYEKDGFTYLLMRNFKHGETVYFAMVDKNLSWGAYYTVYVDMEAPVLGKATGAFDGAWKLTLPTATDTFGADTYYRLNYGEWISYEGEILLATGEKTCVLELKAIDKAGNEAYASYSFGEEIAPPQIELISGKLDEWTNTDVSVRVTPIQGFTTYFWNGEERVLVEEATEFTFTKEANTALYTAILGADGEWIYSEPSWLMMDKTAPVLGELRYRTDRFNFNSSYEYILVNEYEMREEPPYKIYYKFRDIDKDWIEMTLGRVPLYQYIITISGEWFVDVKAVDEAGNESEIKTATILIDVKGPTIGGVKIDRTYDESTGTTKTVIKYSDFKDDYGYVYHIHFQIWDQAAYDNNDDSIINEAFYTEDAPTEYSYDVSNLPQGTYYFLLYLVDNYINGSSQMIYYFHKYDFETTVTVGDYKFYQTETENVLFLYGGEEESITLPEGVNGEQYVLCPRFMGGNEKVKFVRVLEGVTKIRTEAFFHCYNLKEVILPKSLKEIGMDFGESSGIEAVYYEGTAEEWAQIIGHGNVKDRVYFYSETEKEGCWHYVDGKPTLWTVAG